MGKIVTPKKKAAKTAVKRKVGKPSIFSLVLGAKICERISAGESLLKICKDEKMPGRSTVLGWIFHDDKKEFRKAFELAREIQAEVVFEDTMELSEDWIKLIEDDKGDNARIQGLRLQIDTRKWFLARMMPRKFGDKIDVTTKGQKLNEPRRAVVTYVVPKDPAKK